MEAFIAAIPKKFKLIEIELNQANVLAGNTASGTQQLQSGASQFSNAITLRSNYVLNLQPSYEELYSQYRDNIRRNIKKAQAAQQSIRSWHSCFRSD